MIKAECIKNRNESQIKLAEPKSTAAIFTNEKREQFRSIRVDGCAVANATACDWVLEKNGIGRIAVELKGCDVDHAATQIEATLNFLKKEGLTDLKVAGLIICTRSPSYDTKVARLQQRIAKAFKAPLRVKTDGRNLNFEALLKF